MVPHASEELNPWALTTELALLFQNIWFIYQISGHLLSAKHCDPCQEYRMNGKTEFLPTQKLQTRGKYSCIVYFCHDECYFLNPIFIHFLGDHFQYLSFENIIRLWHDNIWHNQNFGVQFLDPLASGSGRKTWDVDRFNLGSSTACLT